MRQNQRGPPRLHRRLGRPDHHGRRRSRPAPAVAGKARRGRARGPLGQPDRPARHRDRAPQPALVRAQHRPGRHRGAAPGVSSGQALDGGNPGRHGRGDRRRLRGQVHAAMVVLGGRRGREAHGPAAAQHVGHRLPDGGAVDHYRRRQMGRDDHSGRSALPASAAHGREEVLALRRDRRDPSPVWRRAATAKDRGGPDRRHERVQRLGRVCRPVSGNPAGGPGP